LALAHPAFLTVPGAVVLLVTAYAISVGAAVRPAADEPAPGRLRALVSLLHLLQPFARTWGRLRARPLPARPAPEGLWTGQRERWLHDLHHELSSGWCAVRHGGPHDAWDLEVSVGPLLRCRLHTAVRWEWDPVARRSWSPSPLGVSALLVVVLLLALAPTAAAVALAGVVAGAALEAVALRRITGQALAHTTADVEPTT
jgi:O-antigen biosynthesis protein